MTKQRTKTAKIVQTVDIPAPDLTATEAAWKEWEAEIRALPAKGLSTARLDLTLASAIARAGTENVLALRARLEAELVDPDLAALESIEGITLAVLHADLRYRTMTDAVAPYADLLPRVNALRGMLLDDLSAQVRRGRAPEQLVADVRAGDNSVRDKANDLNDLAQWYRDNWSKVAGKTSVEPEELAEAASLAVQLLARLGAVVAGNSPRPGELSPAELRRRAFTLLEDRYRQVRRYGAWLFFDEPEGWEAYVPSLWTGRGGSSEKSPAVPEGGEGGEKEPE